MQHRPRDRSYILNLVSLKVSLSRSSTTQDAYIVAAGRDGAGTDSCGIGWTSPYAILQDASLLLLQKLLLLEVGALWPVGVISRSQSPVPHCGTVVVGTLVAGPVSGFTLLPCLQ
ncbi:hypothetical protein Pmani_035191 [Petrolisthes manimaculis]|uniref:Uncharacterized protein n=1 Tax=Petrolisthes manimaculis TaxID=1843537 RepID=A0AAE1NM78_9EUCA|nr:hypothetical protein Pmani_035191 [Petrolisthes manimaculis]